jgi:hypothetical protein
MSRYLVAVSACLVLVPLLGMSGCTTSPLQSLQIEYEPTSATQGTLTITCAIEPPTGVTTTSVTADLSDFEGPADAALVEDAANPGTWSYTGTITAPDEGTSSFALTINFSDGTTLSDTAQVTIVADP